MIIDALRELRMARDGWDRSDESTRWLVGVIADYLLADDEPTQPVDPYAWVRALPNNTPVEAQVIGWKNWALLYWHEDKLCELRDGRGPTWALDELADIRWPLPPDGWAWARKNGRTHVVLAQNGGVFITGDPEYYLIGHEFAAVVPIPEAIHD